MWRRNPADDVSIFSRTPTRQREKTILPGFGLTKLVFLWICGQTRQVIAKGEGFRDLGPGRHVDVQNVKVTLSPTAP